VHHTIPKKFPLQSLRLKPPLIAFPLPKTLLGTPLIPLALEVSLRRPVLPSRSNVLVLSLSRLLPLVPLRLASPSTTLAFLLPSNMRLFLSSLLSFTTTGSFAHSGVFMKQSIPLLSHSTQVHDRVFSLNV